MVQRGVAFVIVGVDVGVELLARYLTAASMRPREAVRVGGEASP